MLPLPGSTSPSLRNGSSAVSTVRRGRKISGLLCWRGILPQSAAFRSGADGARRSSWEQECARAARFFEDLGVAKRLQPVLAHYSLARWTHDQLGFFVMLDRAIKIVDLLPWLARVS